MKFDLCDFSDCLICMQYHPDVNKEPGATDKFKEISNAYEVCIEFTLFTVCCYFVKFSLLEEYAC